MLASRLGMAAVEGLINGKTNVMTGIIDNKIAYTNFKLAITKQKPIIDDIMKLVQILSL